MMRVMIRVGAAIAGDDKTIIEIGSLAQGREDDAAGLHAGQDERFNVLRF